VFRALSAALILCLASAAPALADDDGATPWYIGVRGIYQLGEASNPAVATPATVLATEDRSEHPDPTAAISFLAGYDWHPGHALPVRTEIEAIYRYRHDVDFRQLEPGGPDNYENFFANVGSVSLLFNLDYDMHLQSVPAIRPYVGGGAGVVYTMVDGSRFGYLPGRQEAHSSGFSPSFAAGGGIAWDTPLAGATLELGYRYQYMGDMPDVTFTASSETLSADDYSAHDIHLTLIKRFGLK
jgi:hypothetical protein